MKRLLALALTAILCLSLVACGGGGASAKDSLVVATSGDAIALDPVETNDNQSANAMLQVYEGLVALDKEGKVYPVLAESYEQTDDLTYVFKLRKGVKFHNGEELKASDVVFSLKRAIVAPNVQHLFNMIDSETVKANDDYTVEFKLHKPYAGIVTALAHPGGFICNQKAVEAAGENYKKSPVGTGPFKFVSWSKNDSIVFERNEDYYGDKPQFKSLTFRVIPEANSRTIELESGNIDLAYDIAPVDVERIEKAEKLKLERSLDYGTTYLGFNCKKAPFDNPKVREAISTAVKLEDTISTVWLGVAQAATNCMPPTLQYSTAKDYQVRQQDIEKAKALLKEAGYENGFSCTISTNERQQRIDMATMFKGQLKEIGIDVKVDPLEWSAYNDLLKKGEQDMFMIAWIADTPDPDTFIYPCFHSSALGEGGNYCFYENAELDKYLDDARVTKDGPERAELYKKAQQLIHDECVWLPLCHQELLVGTAANIEGFWMSPFGHYQLKQITKK